MCTSPVLHATGRSSVPELRISEAGSVQFPMVAHAAAIGWTAVPPEVALQKRGGEAGMLFRDELEDVLARFNPWLSDDAVRQLIEKLEAIPPTVEGNRETLAWLRGERQMVRRSRKAPPPHPARRFR
jgi:type I restriction enzyme R subunit